MPADVPLLRAMNALFAAAFSDLETYGAVPPCDAYLDGLLAKDHVMPLVALVAGKLLVDSAYELDKFERGRDASSAIPRESTARERPITLT